MQKFTLAQWLEAKKNSIFKLFTIHNDSCCCFALVKIVEYISEENTQMIGYKVVNEFEGTCSLGNEIYYTTLNNVRLVDVSEEYKGMLWA